MPPAGQCGKSTFLNSDGLRSKSKDWMNHVVSCSRWAMWSARESINYSLFLPQANCCIIQSPRRSSRLWAYINLPHDKVIGSQARTCWKDPFTSCLTLHTSAPVSPLWRLGRAESCGGTPERCSYRLTLIVPENKEKESNSALGVFLTNTNLTTMLMRKTAANKKYENS